MQENNTTQTVEQRCRTVYDSAEKPDGYEVRYRLGGQEGTVRMDHAPGRTHSRRERRAGPDRT